jgi:hypothetical protein
MRDIRIDRTTNQIIKYFSRRADLAIKKYNSAIRAKKADQTIILLIMAP